jgi:hypothetical protein
MTYETILHHRGVSTIISTIAANATPPYTNNAVGRLYAASFVSTPHS